MLSRLFELKDEVRLFFIEHKSFSLSELVNDYSWLATLAYLSDIFTYLNLQGTHVTICKVENKIETMIKKLELWSLRLSKKNYDPFPNIQNFIESTEEEQIKILNISFNIWEICNVASVITFLFQI